MFLVGLNKAIVEKFSYTAGTGNDVLDFVEPLFLVPVLSKFTAEDFWGTESTIEPHCINLDIRMVGLESLEVFRCHDEVHGDELLG